MGVSSLVNRVPYNGDGSSVSFSFPYYFFNPADLLVYLYDTIAGGVVPQVLNSNYSISGTQNAQGLYPNGANVVFVTAPPATSIVVIARAPAETQNYALAQNGNINSAALVQQMDYLTLLVQRLEDQVGRCVQLPDGFGPTFNPALPNTSGLTTAQNAFLQINSSSNGLQLSNALPSYTPIVVPYTSLQAASTTNQIPLFTLPPSGVLTSLFMKHNTAFSGGSITDVVANIGFSGNYTALINSFDIFQSVSDIAYDSFMSNYLSSWANPTIVYLQAISTAANLSALTKGSLSIYYNYTIL